MRSTAIATFALLPRQPWRNRVTASEIVIGTAQDLSGPIVALSSRP
jgi:hypothetical protein